MKIDNTIFHFIPLFQNKERTLIDVLHYILYTHVADIHFFKKSVASSKYCLLIVDFLRFKIYTYPMKNKSLLAKKLEIFYRDIEAKRKHVGSENKMRIQTDLEIK